MQTLCRAEVKGFFVCTQLNQLALRVAYAAITSQVCAMSVSKQVVGNHVPNMEALCACRSAVLFTSTQLTQL